MAADAGALAANNRIAPKLAPLRAVLAARVFDAANDTAAIDVGRFVIDAAANVIAAPGWSPPPGRSVAGIELDVEAGFGANAADVPEVLRHAIRTLVAHWYENRGLVAIGAGVAMRPVSVRVMIASYRVLSL